jgi:CRISPR-associated protein Cas2
MARRRYLLLYDIRDDERLRRVCEVAKKYGYRLQYSVFVCDLSKSELVSLKWDMGDRIDNRKDSVIIVDIGSGASWEVFAYLGQRPRLPSPSATII